MSAVWKRGKRCRQTKKAWIVVAAHEDRRGIGRIRMRRIADASAARLMPFVQDSVEPGSVVHAGRVVGLRTPPKRRLPASDYLSSRSRGSSVGFAAAGSSG